MRQLDRALLYDFRLAGERLRLWKRVGESYEHVLMKALGYLMFVGDYPNLKVEHPVGLRYKPDLVARGADGRFLFWGECGQVAVRKVAWLLKHAGVSRLALFKMGGGVAQLADDIRAEVPAKYRPPGSLEIISFVPEIIELTAARELDSVPREWYATLAV